MKFVPAISPWAVGPLKNDLGGYDITIYDDESKKNDQSKYYIPGLGGENAHIFVMTNPQSISANKIYIIAQTGISEHLSASQQNPVLSNIKVEPLSNIVGLKIYNASILGDIMTITRDDASKFIVAIEQYQQIKNYYQAGGEVNERMQNDLSNICSTIAQTTGYSVESAANDIEE